MGLIEKDLSEPYSVFTYRYFIHNWPHLCFLAVSDGNTVGVIVNKLEMHRDKTYRGYIAMLAVDSAFRGKGMGSLLVKRSIERMQEDGCDEVSLEAEESNLGALKLYANLGFVREKRLHKYYLNGQHAFRLKCWLKPFGDTKKRSDLIAVQQEQERLLLLQAATGASEDGSAATQIPEGESVK